MSKKIVWITGDWALDTDLSVVLYLREHSEYSIKWCVICNHASKVSIPEDVIDKIYYLKFRNRDMRCAKQYYEIFRELQLDKADLIYSDNLGFPYYYPILYRMKKRGTPIVHGAHNVIPYPVWPLWLKMYVKYIFRTNGHFQLFSKFTAEYFKRNYPSKSFFYSPMTLKSFGKVSTDNYNVDKSKLNLLFFGNVVMNKRLDLLIQAVKNLPSDIKQKVHLTIAGKCNNPQPYLEQIDGDLSISVYFKRIDDCEVAELFAKHDFLMLPYQDVAQSGPHMIAYYYNLPVIASDIEGFKERVVDGVIGFLFKSKDEEDLKEKIIKAATMSDEKKAEMKVNLKKFSEDNFSLEEVCRKYIKYFNSLIR